ncbi:MULTISPECIES: hypothetical protein [unclassified Psychrobacter]|uniref:hypothetical protein n=1 Tax=unclassified Psychrobacter TaxID=196806 RepID=UPI0018F5E2E9|nr:MULTISPECIES: hypothetical protein [unclassified Psychrobacter]
MTVNPNPLLATRTDIVRSDYEKLWDMLRTAEDGVIISDVARTIPTINYDKAKAWLSALMCAGYVSREQIKLTRKLPTYRYLLTRDIGQTPPRIDAKGAPKPVSVGEAVWRTIRIIKTFNANQVIASGSTPERPLNSASVRQYLKELYNAGYLQIRQAGQAKQLAVYQLLHNTGPKAPEIQRGKKVYDANLGMIVYDPEKPLPPSHEAEKNNSEQAKKAKKGARYDRG